MSADDDFPDDMKEQLAAARAEQARKQSADAATLAGMRAAVERIEQIAMQPPVIPDAQASERVEHAADVALPSSITLHKLPKVQLEPQIDPRRMMTQPSMRAVEGHASLGPDPRANAAVAGRTVGGNTGRFPDTGDGVPPSTDGIDSHELPVQPAGVARRRWVPMAMIGGVAAMVAAIVAMRGGEAPELARASTKAVSDVARSVAAGASPEPLGAGSATGVAAGSAAPSAGPSPSEAPPAASVPPIETASPKSNPPGAAAAPIHPKRLPFEPD